MQLGLVLATNGMLFFLLWGSSRYLWTWSAAWWTAFALVGTYLWMARATSLTLLLDTFSSQLIVVIVIFTVIGNRHDKLKAELSKT